MAMKEVLQFLVAMREFSQKKFNFQQLLIFTPKPTAPRKIVAPMLERLS
jgi:hypothetical protein